MGKRDKRHSKKMRRREGQAKLKARKKNQAQAKRNARREKAAAAPAVTA
jgi:hypothetical protein